MARENGRGKGAGLPLDALGAEHHGCAGRKVAGEVRRKGGKVLRRHDDEHEIRSTERLGKVGGDGKVLR